MNEQISNQEIAMHVEGIADRATTRRVLRAALTEPSVRERLTALEVHDAEYKRTASDSRDAISDERSRRLRAALRNTVLAVGAEKSAAPATAAPERGARALMEKVLQIGKQLLTLPCLAPVTASPAPDSHIHRQTVQTGDGVRIEFQQLPGSAPFRLRVLVDSSQLQRADSFAAPYNVAYLTLEDGGSGRTTDAPPDTHVLVVPLNNDGRGFADFIVGGGAAKQSLPAPAGACRLVSATLKHES